MLWLAMIKMENSCFLHPPCLISWCLTRCSFGSDTAGLFNQAVLVQNLMSMFAVLPLLPPNGQENKHLEHAN